MTKLRTLKDVRDTGLGLLAVCHGVTCRHTKEVDLTALIKAVGEMASVLPVFGQAHFSERMRCPSCGKRGMFVWPDLNQEPNPHLNSALAFRVIAVDRMTDAPRFDVLRAGDRRVAQAGFDVAEAVYPMMKFEMMWHRRVIHQSHPDLVKGRKIG